MSLFAVFKKISRPYILANLEKLSLLYREGNNSHGMEKPDTA